MHRAFLAALLALPLLTGCGQSESMAQKVKAAQAAADDANSKVEELQTKVEELETDVQDLKDKLDT